MPGLPEACVPPLRKKGRGHQDEVTTTAGMLGHGGTGVAAAAVAGSDISQVNEIALEGEPLAPDLGISSSAAVGRSQVVGSVASVVLKRKSVAYRSG